jgi:hypothetical protein
MSASGFPFLKAAFLQNVSDFIRACAYAQKGLNTFQTLNNLNFKLNNPQNAWLRSIGLIYREQLPEKYKENFDVSSD